MRDNRDEPDPFTVQADILSFLLDQSNPIALAELHLEMAEPTYGPYDGDTVGQSTRDLVHAGLLHRNGDFVFATRAAIHYQQLSHLSSKP